MGTCSLSGADASTHDVISALGSPGKTWDPPAWPDNSIGSYTPMDPLGIWVALGLASDAGISGGDESLRLLSDLVEEAGT